MPPTINSSIETKKSQGNKNIQEKSRHIITNLGREKKQQTSNVAILIISIARKKRQGKNKFTFILNYLSHTYSQFSPSNTTSGIIWKNKQTKPKQKNNQTRNSRKEEAQGAKAGQGGFDSHRAAWAAATGWQWAVTQVSCLEC